MNTEHPETCFACGEGQYQEVIEDYRLDLPEGETLTVPKLLILRCDKCGEDTIPPESSRRIETAVDQHQDVSHKSPCTVRHLSLHERRLSRSLLDKKQNSANIYL